MEHSQKEILWSAEMLALVNEQVLSLKTPETAWQPTEYLPDFSSDDWHEQISDIQQSCSDVPDSVFMILIGNCITEEALPSYMNWLNQHTLIADRSGNDEHPWAKWTRAWTAEENKHGDLLNKYLHFTGRVDMKHMEITINRLISNGFNTQTDNDPYIGMAFTSFQERGTRISHHRTGLLAQKAGDKYIKGICSVIAADEGKHETVYQSFISKVFEMDPNGMMKAFAKLMDIGIVMPSKEIGPDLFKYFSAVAEDIGVYTFQDYIEIMKFLINKWKVPTLTGLDPEAQKAQDYICRLPERFEKLAARKKVSAKVLDRDYLWVKQL